MRRIGPEAAGWLALAGGIAVVVGTTIAWRGARAGPAPATDPVARTVCSVLGACLVALATAGASRTTGHRFSTPLAAAVGGGPLAYLLVTGPASAGPGLLLTSVGGLAALFGLSRTEHASARKEPACAPMRRYCPPDHPTGSAAGFGLGESIVESGAGGVDARLPLLTVTYTGEPDVVFEFPDEGDSRVFGRDDTVCDIVIWSAINGQELARAAGRIWRMDGELWLRNLSTTHELRLQVPNLPPEQPLPRRKDQQSRGAARSIPSPVCSILAPGGCELRVRQLHQPRPEALNFGLDTPTMSRVPEVPDSLRTVAAALCEPLLRGGYLPASYREVMARLGEPSLKIMRKQVADLCRHYISASEDLRGRVEQRMLREQRQLELPDSPRLRRGVWSYEPATQGHLDDEETNRRRAFALPDYYEVAVLLVSHYRITMTDVDELLPPRADV